MALPAKIKKRDRTLVRFNAAKIKSAVCKAAYEVFKNKTRAENVAARVIDEVIKKISQVYKNRTPPLESIQDIVEATLMKQGYAAVAKSYILYREKHRQIRQIKEVLDVKDDLKLSLNSIEVLKMRYLLKDENQNIVETPGELFERVAYSVSQAEKNFKSKVSLRQAQDTFSQMMKNLEFMPNSPTLMNAGTSLGQLSACFVLPVADSIADIFNALGDMAKIHQSGGGTGFNFSHLRPKGDIVLSTRGEASGPVSFMKVFDQATGVIVQGGRRRGANMGLLRCDHPDIVDFIEAKLEAGGFENFNLSVGVTSKFMEAVKENKEFSLVNPRTKKAVTKINARAVFDMIVNAAWHTGDPGLIFLDQINAKNPTPPLGKIETTNPCGELPLLAYESCNLASINLVKMVKKNTVDWGKLADSIRWGIRFLDNVIEVNNFPLTKTAAITGKNRKVGLGVMGFADMLIKLGIPYTSKKAVEFASLLMKFFHRESLRASCALAQERGVFPNFKQSVYAKNNLRLRNATVNTIAPTGSISIITGSSSGIEPLFAVSFVRRILSGTKLVEVNPLFLEAAARAGFYNKGILGKIAKQGSIQGIGEIPSDVRKVFVTAFDVTARQHLLIQAAFQKHTDNAVSKTINLAPQATAEDIRRIYLEAYRLKLKGITVYRYASKDKQVLSFEHKDRKPGRQGSELITADSEYSGGCVVGTCPF
ncbi:MAG: adenosylcobalamin-dependent ribonucleoside-diphosphate reductase [Candidatus Omnitrophota bacterium]|nr:MAG: adenosylcobalamin-dependent ribonucleoside-diphosphate reductase [Candidatus Omnitrophota bacterium]